MTRTRVFLAVLCVFGSALPVLAQPGSNLAGVPLEELMNIAVTTATYLEPDEMVGGPQNPRRFSLGVDLQVK